LSISLILLFAITEFFLCLSPGPAVLCVVSQGLRHGARASIFGNTGVLTANAIYFLLSIAGLGAALLASHNVYQVIKWIGAAYLVFMGIRMIVGSRGEDPLDISGGEKYGQKLFTQGLVTQISNPKAIVYFTALLPQFIEPESNIARQFIVLGVISIVIEFPVLLMYGWAAAKSSGYLKDRLHFRWIDRLAGLFLIAVGLRLFFTQI